MIFVILGTQKIPFPRLLEAVDSLIETEGIEEEVVAQSGHTHYLARNFKCIPFLSEAEFQSYIDKASLVITHSGSGSIFSAINHGKKIIAVARLHKYGEMVDDHQTEIVRKLSEEGYIIDGTSSLADAWEKQKSFVPSSDDFNCHISESLEERIPSGEKVLFVCNNGGHYSEMMCLSSMRNSYDVMMLSDNKSASDDFGGKAIYMNAFNYSGNKLLNFVGNFFASVKVCLKLRPDCMISTGAGIAVPVFMAARFFGIKLIFIESRARVYSRSKAGRMLSRICDNLYVQWPEMKEVYGRKAEYHGTLK